MTTMEGPAPTRVDERIDTLDVLRGVAICGILLMNIPYMGGIGDTEGLSYPFHWNADWVAWLTQSLFFEGTMRGLFTMLFGAGMLLMLRRSEGVDGQVAPVDVWTRRCFWLMVFGVVQWAVFMWFGEILFNYGMTGLFLLAFRTARPRTLLICGALALIAVCGAGYNRGASRTAILLTSVPAAAAQAAHKPLTDEQKSALKAAEKARESLHPKPADVAKEKAERTWLPTLIGYSWKNWRPYNIDAPYWWWGLLESGGFMLIGMALFRTGVLTGGAPAATYAMMMTVGYLGGFAIRLYFLWWGSRTGFDFDVTKLDATMAGLRGASYEPARLLITLGHVGLLCTLFRSGALGRAWPLRALGRMALTTYSLQSILTSILFYGLGFVGAVGFAGLMGIAVTIWIVTGAFAVWWLKSHAMGPAELALRSLAYGTFSAKRRPQADAALAAVPAI